jgi:hypothetical protein
VAALGSSGCQDDPPPEDPVPVRLATAEGWSRVTDPTIDVFAALRPPDATCDDAGYYVEPVTQALEIQTDLCDYLTVTQATLEPLAPGDVVAIRAFHYELQAPQPGEGYLGFALDGRVEWEVHVPIPGEADALGAEIVIDRALPAGTEMQVHVHNHGANSWELRSVMVTPVAL